MAVEGFEQLIDVYLSGIIPPETQVVNVLQLHSHEAKETLNLITSKKDEEERKKDEVPKHHGLAGK